VGGRVVTLAGEGVGQSALGNFRPSGIATVTGRNVAPAT
jgi:hypothetical protein